MVAVRLELGVEVVFDWDSAFFVTQACFRGLADTPHSLPFVGKNTMQYSIIARTIHECFCTSNPNTKSKNLNPTKRQKTT
jgi:hypothetical protein